MAFTYRVDLIPDDNDTVRVECPDLPAMNTFGEDAADALLRAVDAIEAVLIDIMDERKDIPAPRYTGGTPVHLPALTNYKLALYGAMRAKGFRKSDLAKALGIHPPQVDRLLDLAHSSKIEQVEAALAVVGLRIPGDVQEAA